MSEYENEMKFIGSIENNNGPTNGLKGNVVSKLVLQISHTCNLRCPYCCSDKGLFGKNKPQVMTDRIISDSLDLFTRLFSEIKTVYLFGGEPTLNMDGIESVCKKVDQLVREGRIKNLPFISLTTNGMNASERFIQLIQDYNINIGVSMDGPSVIHDKMRIDIKGQGTYQNIVNNIREMKRKTGQPSSISITYTPLHLQSNIRLWDMLEILKKETGVSSFLITPSFDTNYSNGFDPFKYDSKKVIDELTEVVRKSVMSMAESEDPIIELHVPIFTEQFVGRGGQQQLNFCPAGRTYFALSYDGTIYPCQNLPEEDNMKIGNIYDNDVETKILKSNIGIQLNEANIVASNHLNGSWTSRCVKICPAYNLSEAPDFSTLAPNRKTMYIAMAQAYGKAMVDVLFDKKRFDQFLLNSSKTREIEED